MKIPPLNSEEPTIEKRFRETIDIIGGILGPELPQLRLRATRLFYPLFCSIYHLKVGLPHLTASKENFKASEYPKLKNALERVDELIENVEAAENSHEELKLTAEERRFYDAYNEHWVHADKRMILTQYISKLLVKALND